MSSLQGGDALKRRMKAMRLSFKPIGRAWADTAVELGRPDLPIRPASMKGPGGAGAHPAGTLHGSIRRKSATQYKATVAAYYTAYFIDAGVKPHSMQRRSRGQDRTVFAKRHPGYRARPFRAYIAHESLRRHPMAETLIKQWNDAA